MAPSKARSLAQQLADLDDPTPKGMNKAKHSHPYFSSELTRYTDFDPEDLERDIQSSDDEEEKPSDVNAGREHYQAVG